MIVVGTYENWEMACRLRGLRGPYALANGSGYQFVDENGTAAIWNTSHLARGSIFDGYDSTRGIEVSDQSIEKEIQDKGLTAPRVTPDHIEEQIHSEHYFIASDAVQTTNAVNHLGDNPIPSYALDLLTICVLVLRNGFTVTGESACASPKNFDAGLGRKIARQNAIAKIWPLEGYLLKQRLADARA